MDSNWETGMTPFGPWEDPRSASPGGCGGAIKDIVWAADADELLAAVEGAMTHTTLGPVQQAGGTLHVLEEPAWIEVHPQFDRNRVLVVASLIDFYPASSPSSDVVLARLIGSESPYRFAIEQIKGDCRGRLTAKVEVQALPFIPLRLGQRLLDFIEFSFGVHELAPELDGIDSYAHRADAGLMSFWCGTVAAQIEMTYVSTDAHPRDTYWNGNEDDDWSEGWL